jgi:hypothetical protein
MRALYAIDPHGNLLQFGESADGFLTAGALAAHRAGGPQAAAQCRHHIKNNSCLRFIYKRYSRFSP